MSEITYNSKFNTEGGYIEIVDETKGPVDDQGTQLPADPLKAEHKKTLIHLLFWALYTRPGRDLFRANKVSVGATTLTQAQEDALRAAFKTFGVQDEALIKAILDAHVAAELWVRANNASAVQDRDTQEKIYLSKMAFITWQLWEDAKAHEFSMGW